MHQRRDGEHSVRERQWVIMEQTEVTHAHKHSGTKGCTFGSFNFHQDVPKQFFSCSNGQYGSSHILSKNGRYHQSGNSKSCKEI